MKGKGGGLLALISGGESPMEETETDPFEQGFKAFRGAMKSGDAMKGKKALRLMMKACEDDDEEGDDYSDDEEG